MNEFDAWQIELHGHRVIYRKAGSGPPVVLIHGMVNSSRHWEPVALRLADSYTVIAPDLIGHGDSATPRGDYSLGAHAASIRDLLAAIGVDRATIVGHSLGGGVAMQFFYQFPQRVERLALVSSGGLGHDVSPLLRSAALPGASALLSLAAHRRVLSALMDAGRAPAPARLRARASTCRPSRGRCGRSRSRSARRAFLQTLRSVIDARGQRVSATRPPLPAELDADAHRVGRARQHDPARPRPRHAPSRARQPLRDPPPRRPLPQPRGPGRPRRGPARLHRDDGAGATSTTRTGAASSPAPRRAGCARPPDRAAASDQPSPAGGSK